MIKHFISTFLIATLFACATVQSPTGGDKDNKAPILYQSNPANQSTNFNGTEIKLFFNEWMQLEQLNKELIITPRIEIEYEASLKKQELTIELLQPLADSTTYTFNFREALSDITEGNLWENPIIAFSTGPYLDSLQITGQITQLLNQTAADNYTVGLYDADTDTANLREGKPVYFTTTDKEGKFQMQNLQKGSYLLYAFDDKNNNLINESSTESFGFYPSVINLTDSIPPLSLNTYQRNEDTLRLKKYSPVAKDFIIQYNKGLSNYKITNPMDSSQHIYANDVEGSKYIKIYKENFPNVEYETDSIKLYIDVRDSINQYKRDTVFFKVRESRLTNADLKILNTPETNIVSGNQHFQYQLSKPIHAINYDSIQLRLDTIPIKTFSETDLTLSSNKKLVDLHFELKQEHIASLKDSIRIAADSINQTNTTTSIEKDSTIIKTSKSQSGANKKSKGSVNSELQTNNKEASNTDSDPEQAKPSSKPNSAPNELQLNIYTGKSAFIGIESDSSSSSKANITFKEAENYGIIKGTIKNVESNFIIELLTEKYEKVATIINQETYQFRYVKPGTYRLRLILDTNANTQWDAGDPFALQPEETIFYLNELITVKANWEILDKNFDLSVDKPVDSGE